METIYGLFDPMDTRLPFYIGVSVQPEARLSQHLSCDGSNSERDKRIRHILKTGNKVVMRVLETLEDVGDREEYWIRFFLREGAALTNINFVGAELQLRSRSKSTVKKTVSLRLQQIALTDAKHVAVQWNIDGPDVLRDAIDIGLLVLACQRFPITEDYRMTRHELAMALNGYGAIIQDFCRRYG